MVTSVPPESYDNEYAPVDAYEFSFIGRAIRIQIHFESNLDDEEETYAYFARLVAPLLERHKLTFVSVGLDLDYMGGPPWMWAMTVEGTTRARPMSLFAVAGEEICAVLGAVVAGEFTTETLAILIASGHSEALIGQVESQWLEAKSTEYPLDTFAGQIAFAEVVAGMANGGTESLIVIGIRTRATPNGGEIIRGVTPLPLDAKSVRRHRTAIRNHVYPSPAGLTVSEVLVGTGRLLVVRIPAQAEELKPFLVHGAIVDGRSHGAFFGISARSGDEHVPQTAQMIHATLAAGRALLRPDGELTVIRRSDLAELERIGRPSSNPAEASATIS